MCTLSNIKMANGSQATGTEKAKPSRRSDEPATLLNTRIGYAAAAEIAKESEKSQRPVRDIVAERGLMSGDEFDVLVLQAARDGVI